MRQEEEAGAASQQLYAVDAPLSEGLAPFRLELEPNLGFNKSATDTVLSDHRVQAYLLRPKTWPARIVCLLIWLAALAGLFTALYFLSPLVLDKVIVPAQRTIQESWSPVAVAFVVLAGTAIVPLVLLPAGPFIWLAAVALGVWKGYLVVQLGTALGMTASYWLGRLLFRARIRRWVEDKDWAQALFLAVKEAGPFKVVLLMRLGPAPYAWLSYACSLSSDIRYLPYIAASLIGRSPHNLIDIYIGRGVSTVGEIREGHSLDTVTIISYIVGAVLAVGISIWGYLHAKRALRDIKARAMAREQVLTAFSFPELEDFDEEESSLLQHNDIETNSFPLSSAGRSEDTTQPRLQDDGKRGVQQNGRRELPRSPRRLFEDVSKADSPKRGFTQGKQQSPQAAHVVADCSHSDKANLLQGQERSDQ